MNTRKYVGTCVRPGKRLTELRVRAWEAKVAAGVCDSCSFCKLWKESWCVVIPSFVLLNVLIYSGVHKGPKRWLKCPLGWQKHALKCPSFHPCPSKRLCVPLLILMWNSDTSEFTWICKKVDHFQCTCDISGQSTSQCFKSSSLIRIRML